MNTEKASLAQKYFPTVENFFNPKGANNLVPVDFKKSIWQFVWLKKFQFIAIFLLEALMYVFLTALPLVLVSIVNLKRLDYFIYFMLVWVFFNILPFFNISTYARITAEIMQSVYYSAVQFFLKVDPIFHTTKSSGQIIAKVNRGSEAYEDLFDIFLFDILKITVSMTTSVLTIIYINLQLGLVALATVIIITIFSVVSKYFSNKILIQAEIEADDKKKEVGMESLTLNNYIRSTFATTEQDLKVKRKSLKMVSVLTTVWMGNISLDVISRLIYLVGFSIIGFITISQVISEAFTPLLGIGILLAYYQGSRDVWTIGRSIQKFTDRMQRITDLFKFINTFGVQTYPVLEGDLKTTPRIVG